MNSLRHFRILRGISQRQLATNTGISRPTLRKWENGGIIKQSRRAILAAALGISVLTLLAKPRTTYEKK